MFITVKHVIRRYAGSDEEVKKLQDLGVTPAIEEVRLYAHFRAEDVRFVDEVVALADSVIQSKVVVQFGDGLREYLLSCTHDEALLLVQDALGEKTLN